MFEKLQEIERMSPNDSINLRIFAKNLMETMQAEHFDEIYFGLRIFKAA